VVGGALGGLAMAAEQFGALSARPSDSIERTGEANGLTNRTGGTVASLRSDVAAGAPEIAGDSCAPRSRVAGESVAGETTDIFPRTLFISTLHTSQSSME
jgi:hypothetical protein